eukprot:515528_1
MCTLSVCIFVSNSLFSPLPNNMKQNNDMFGLYVSISGSIRQKVFPIQWCTGYENNDYSFQWTDVDQPPNKTKETGDFLAKMIGESIQKYPAIATIGPNMQNSDCGSPEGKLLRLLREVHELLIWCKDPSHCADTVDRVAMQETFGTCMLSYGQGKRYSQSFLQTRAIVCECYDGVIVQQNHFDVFSSKTY